MHYRIFAEFICRWAFMTMSRYFLPCLTSLALAWAGASAMAQTKSPTPAAPAAKTQPRPAAAAPAAPARKAGKVTAARIRVVPERYTGVCPAKLQFLGIITTDGPAEVKYTWASSDGATWPETTIKMPAAGTRPVNESREMGAPGQVENGWIQLKVLSPNTVLSAQGKYLVACGRPKPPSPTPTPAKKK
jgi:hypothetical protein